MSKKSKVKIESKVTETTDYLNIVFEKHSTNAKASNKNRHEKQKFKELKLASKRCKTLAGYFG